MKSAIRRPVPKRASSVEVPNCVYFEDVSRYLDFVSAFEDFVESQFSQSAVQPNAIFTEEVDLDGECNWMKSLRPASTGETLIDGFSQQMKSVLSWSASSQPTPFSEAYLQKAIIELRHRLLLIGQYLFN